VGIATVRTSRRQLLGAAALAAPIPALPGAVDAGATAPSTPTTGLPRRVPAPSWTFGVLQVEDPYAGTIQVPQTPPAGTRYVAAEVEVDNDSDQPLAFTPAEIRLRDAAGIEYRGGSALGTEPSINQRNLNGGERSRGWVWFTIAAAATPIELVYVGPQPQFRVSLTE
jgi:Domain of unknown function (DUF4352)